MRYLSALLWLCLAPVVLCAEDYYKLLNIDKSASERDIKRAYRTLSKKYHPDKNPYGKSSSSPPRQLSPLLRPLSPLLSQLWPVICHSPHKC